MAEVVSANNVEASLETVDDGKHGYDHHHHGNEKLIKLDQHMRKYDVDGDGVFSPDEVRNIVRDMEEAEQQAKNMGRLAAVVFVTALCLCGALLGLMFAANEASKEGHISGGVQKDLSGNPVSSAGLKSYASMFEFPTLPASALNEVGFVSFSAKDGSDTLDMRCTISSWTRSQTSKVTTLVANDGSELTIQGDGSSATVKRGATTYEIIKPATRRRRLSSGKGKAKLFRSVKEMNQHFHAHHRGTRRLMGDGTMGGKEDFMDEPMAAIEDFMAMEWEPYPDKCYYHESDECMCLYDESFCPGFTFGTKEEEDSGNDDATNHDDHGSGSGSGSGFGQRRLMMAAGSGSGSGSASGSAAPGVTFDSCMADHDAWWDSLTMQDMEDCDFYVPPPPPTGEVQCPSQAAGNYCDCHGDCHNNPSFCECPDAVACCDAHMHDMDAATAALAGSGSGSGSSTGHDHHDHGAPHGSGSGSGSH